MVAFLQNNLPLQSSLMKEVSCLSPNSKLREWARNPAGRSPNLITQREGSLVKDQWKLYQGEIIIAEWEDDTNGKPEKARSLLETCV